MREREHQEEKVRKGTKEGAQKTDIAWKSANRERECKSKREERDRERESSDRI